MYNLSISSQLIDLSGPIIITPSPQCTLAFTFVYSRSVEKWIMTGTHHYNITQDSFTVLKTSFCGWAWWCMSVIPALRRWRQRGSQVQGQPELLRETIYPKIK
jgi:hypothetical protein